MRIAVTLIPTGDWPAVREAALAADSGGIDAIGLWDHFHSNRPEEALVGGWCTYGALAMLTERVRLTPMVLNHLSYPLGTLAKESASLAIVSGGRFELGIGAGGWPGEHEIWGQPFPSGPERVRILEEKVSALRGLWSGEPVRVAGEHVRLEGAASRPAPPVPPRVVVGGGVRRLVHSAVRYADELNVGDDAGMIAVARREIEASGRRVALSATLFWGEWPAEPEGTITALEEHGVERVFVNLLPPFDLLPRLADLASALKDETGHGR